MHFHFTGKHISEDRRSCPSDFTFHLLSLNLIVMNKNKKGSRSQREMTRPTSVRSIMLDEVQESSPAESEEEKRVMRYLERSNATGSSSRFFDAATSIPEDLASEISMTEVIESSSDPDALNALLSLDNVDGKLYQLTNSINMLHLEMHTNNPDANGSVRGDVRSMNIPVPAQVFKDAKNKNSQADNFAANAGKLYEKFNFANKRKNSRRKNSKRGDTNAGSSDIENPTDSGRGSSKKFNNKMVHRSLESLHEFRFLVSSRKGYVLTYVRNTFFFVVLPSTLLAAM